MNHFYEKKSFGIVNKKTQDDEQQINLHTKSTNQPITSPNILHIGFFTSPLKSL